MGSRHPNHAPFSHTPLKANETIVLRLVEAQSAEQTERSRASSTTALSMVATSTPIPTVGGNGVVEVTLTNNESTKLGIKLMKNKDHSEGKGVAIKLVEPGGQAEGTACEAGQIITHVNGTDVRDMTSKEAAPIIKANETVVLTLAPAGSYTGSDTPPAAAAKSAPAPEAAASSGSTTEKKTKAKSGGSGGGSVEVTLINNADTKLGKLLVFNGLLHRVVRWYWNKHMLALSILTCD
jgi:C-terminal processing protease CtpA/Prc